MSKVIEDYFDALERLQSGRCQRVTNGTKITKDSVSLEAGRKKGTIKKSRPIFRELIAAIEAAETERGKPAEDLESRFAALKAESQRNRVLWEEAIVREICLVKQLWSERKEWAAEKSALTGEKVSSILSKKTRL